MKKETNSIWQGDEPTLVSSPERSEGGCSELTPDTLDPLVTICPHTGLRIRRRADGRPSRKEMRIAFRLKRRRLKEEAARNQADNVEAFAALPFSSSFQDNIGDGLLNVNLSRPSKSCNGNESLSPVGELRKSSETQLFSDVDVAGQLILNQDINVSTSLETW